MHSCEGFTLTEVLLALALSVLVTVVMAPVIRQVWQRWQVEQTSTALAEAWQQARLLAISHNQTVTFCGSSDAVHCDGNWQGQWLTQLGAKRMAYNNAPNTAADIRFKSNQPTQQAVAFSALGSTQGQQGRFAICDGSACRELIFIRSGRLRVSA